MRGRVLGGFRVRMARVERKVGAEKRKKRRNGSLASGI